MALISPFLIKECITHPHQQLPCKRTQQRQYFTELNKKHQFDIRARYLARLQSFSTIHILSFAAGWDKSFFTQQCTRLEQFRRSTLHVLETYLMSAYWFEDVTQQNFKQEVLKHSLDIRFTLHH